MSPSSRRRSGRAGRRAASSRDRDEEPLPQEMIYGVHAVLEALDRGRVSFDKLLVARGRRGGSLARIRHLARSRRVPVQLAPAAALDRITGGGNHQGAVGLIPAREYAAVEDVIRLAETRGMLVLADGVQDPRNLGAIIRTAGAAGAAGVVIPARGACGLTASVAKAAAGAVESTPVARHASLAALIPRLKERGFRIVGLDPGGEKLWKDADFRSRTVLVLGGERGLRLLVRRRCDELVRLPVRAPVDSLNVSVAAGIALYEALRQKGAEV